jgi:hypothetical protein
LFILFLAFVNLRVGLRHRAKEGPHLLRRQAGAAGLQGELDAVGDDQVAPDLDGSGAPRRRGQGAGGLLLEQLADPFQRQPRQLPLPHQQKLLDVALGVVGALADALRTIDQSGLDVVPDGATRQLGKSAQSRRG